MNKLQACFSFPDDKLALRTDVLQADWSDDWWTANENEKCKYPSTNTST